MAKRPSMGQTLAMQSGDAVVEDGFIVIRVQISVLKNAFKLGPLELAFKITDLPVFTKELVNALNDGDPDNGTTPVHRLFDAAMESVVDDGSLAVEYINETPR